MIHDYTLRRHFITSSLIFHFNCKDDISTYIFNIFSGFSGNYNTRKMKRARLDDALRDYITGIDYRHTLMSKQTQLEERSRYLVIKPPFN